MARIAIVVKYFCSSRRAYNALDIEYFNAYFRNLSTIHSLGVIQYVAGSYCNKSDTINAFEDLEFNVENRSSIKWLHKK